MHMTLPKGYHPSNSSTIIRSHGVEIENVFISPKRISAEWRKDAEGNGFSFSRNTAHSVYVEVAQEVEGNSMLSLELLRNGISLRIRRGGIAEIVDDNTGEFRVSETFPNQFALKRRNNNFQAVADRVARRIFPEAENLGVYPYIRDEIEGAHEHPKASVEMSIDNLPEARWNGYESIKSLINDLVEKGKIQGVKTPKGLVLRPIVTTNVKRRRSCFFIDPNKKIDFNENWPSSEPTTQMLKTGVYLCLEVSIDESVCRRPPKNATLSKIVGAEGNAFYAFKRMATTPLLEYETKSEHTGPNTTDAKAIAAYVNFGLALREYVHAEWGYELLPTRSKGISAIGSLPECKSGRLHDVYHSALAYAP